MTNTMSPSPNDPASRSSADDDTLERDDAVIGVAVRNSLVVLLLLALAGGGLAWWLTRPDEAPAVVDTPLVPVERRERPKVSLPQVPFVDATMSAGITFVHENGANGEKLLPETMGGGCAFFDADGDGDQDLVLVGGQPWSWDSAAAGAAPSLALYLNDGKGQFTDKTAGSGLDISLYGMGVAAGDYDNDGRSDLFISAVGPNRLFHNEGDGVFKDVTADAGVAGADEAWGTSCGWLDYDRDGDLDLFVLNYVEWSREKDASQNFQLTGGGRAYGRPQNFQGTFPYLYRNDGEGKFSDVTVDAQLDMVNPASDVPMSKGLGVTFADFNYDGWIDIIVANDTVQNFLFRNKQDGTFEELGALAGVAFDMEGNARGAMGIDTGHFRNDDSLGVAIGNFANEMTALYVTEGQRMLFMDEAIATGLGPNTRLQLTFGVCLLDCDLDGRLDLLTANGHLEEDINRVQPSQTYAQSPQLFWNCGPEHATEWLPLTEDQSGPDFFRPLVGRGASFADIDADGDLDILLMSCGQAPRLLRNDQALGHHWLRVSLEGTTVNRQGIGAWVVVEAGGRKRRQQIMPSRSYLAQVEPVATFGLGTIDKIDSLTIEWPDGTTQEVPGPVTVDQMLTVRQPSGPESVQN
jgi:hypothetical protein